MPARKVPDSTFDGPEQVIPVRFLFASRAIQPIRGRSPLEDGQKYGENRLAGWPSEMSAAQQVHMQVRNAFTGITTVVNHQSIAGFVNSERPGNR